MLVILIGINDCGSGTVDELDAIVETIFDIAHDLYVKAAARNFVLVDMPPIHRSPQGTELPKFCDTRLTSLIGVESGSTNEIEEHVIRWNNCLRARAIEFGTSSKEATVFLFSSNEALTEVLDDPTEFDLSEDDPDTEGGSFWEDDLHLTSDIHGILAERLLSSVIFPPV